MDFCKAAQKSAIFHGQRKKILKLGVFYLQSRFFQNPHIRRLRVLQHGRMSANTNP